MPVKQPAPGDLEPIETASRDELQSLQLQRLKKTLQHAYDHVPHYRAAFDAAVDTLARIETARRYGPNPPDDDDALAAEQAASVLHRAVWSMLGRRDRVRQLVGSTGRS